MENGVCKMAVSRANLAGNHKPSITIFNPFGSNLSHKRNGRKKRGIGGKALEKGGYRKGECPKKTSQCTFKKGLKVVYPDALYPNSRFFFEQVELFHGTEKRFWHTKYRTTACAKRYLRLWRYFSLQV